MDSKVSKGIQLALGSLQAASVGKKVLDWKKKLPGEKKKAMQKAAKQAVKASRKAERKQFHKKRNKKAVKRTKGIGRIALAVWNRYF